MRRVPVCVAVMACLGIVLGRSLSVAAAVWYGGATAGMLLAACFLRRRFVFAALCALSCVFLGAGLCAHRRVLSERHILHARQKRFWRSEWVTVQGWVSCRPVQEGGGTRFPMQARRLIVRSRSIGVEGELWVRVRGNCFLSYGQRVEARGRMRSQRWRDRETVGFFVRSPALVRLLPGRGGGVVRSRAYALRGALEAYLAQTISPVAAGIVAAMTLGERARLEPSVYAALMKSGTVHILVVSGFNTGLVIAVVLLLLKAAGLRRALSFCVSLPLILFYCVMTGASAPVVRATVMAFFYLFGQLLRREADALNSCAMAGLFLLALDPQQLFNIGFQLSFASVLSLIVLYPRLCARLRLERLAWRWARRCAEAAVASFSAWLGTAGIIAVAFRMVSPVTVAANFFIVPLASGITLCGFGLFLLGPLWPAAGHLLSRACEGMCTALLWVNAQCISLPAASFWLS